MKHSSSWRRALTVGLLVVPCSALAADVYYPEYKRDPVPPVVVIEPLAIEDVGGEPACIPANDGCEDPEALATFPSAVAIAGESGDRDE
jgi:hypothetical protein